MREDLHVLTEDEIQKWVGSSLAGLTEKEAQIRLSKYGKNKLPERKRDSFFIILGKQLLDPIVLLLVVATVFSLMIGEVIDALAIAFIILVDLFMGAYQEWKASKNAEALAHLIEVKVKVKRDGIEKEIDSENLVIGDLVLLESGNKISADLRLLEIHNLTIDESILTGESMSVSKELSSLEQNTPLAERKNMAYAGTSVLTGRATSLVVATGIHTEIGKIAGKVAETKETKSPLTIRMEKFSKQISILVLIVALLIALLLFIKKTPGSEIFLSVIALSVSAMPEGLPLALTMALTIASNRMSKKNVIVKKLNAVESLGSCTVIASDKTGTLTVNEQTAKRILLPSSSLFHIEGTGYNDIGKVVPKEDAKIEDALLLSKLGVLNNEATFEKTEKGYTTFGDSVDVAFLALGKKIGVETSNSTIKGEIPYESENKYSAVFYEEKGQTYGTVKGSLEKVLEFCKTMYVNGEEVPLDESFLQKQNETLAKDGYRVIALAYQKVEIDGEGSAKDLKNLCFMGMVGFMDPIRLEARESIAECKTAGIEVIMITGDHPLTAFKIAKELGLVTSMDEITTGKEVSDYLNKGEKAFDTFIKTKKIFTRVTPLDKLEIVESYKRRGEFVAVTGDGVNDAPAIKSANIGIAMGSGTDVAKETSSMIILDDNFKSIVAGVKEGRNAYSNIRKVSYMLLSCGLAEVLFFLLSIAFNLPLPLVAIQLLWLNIVTDGLQDFALSFEKAEKGIMEEKPRSPKESIFNKTLLVEVLLAGLTIGLTVFGVWFFLVEKVHMNVATARGYIMVLMVFMQNMHVLNCRSEKKSIFKVSLLTNPLIIFSIVSALVLQIIVSEVPFLSAFLSTSSVPILDMFYLFLFSISIVLVMEVYKKVKYHKSSK